MQTQPSPVGRPSFWALEQRRKDACGRMKQKSLNFHENGTAPSLPGQICAPCCLGIVHPPIGDDAASPALPSGLQAGGP